MSTKALKFIRDKLASINIDYEFMEWTTNPVPNPYFVGEYTESEFNAESTLQESTFILTGTGTSYYTLEQKKDLIKSLFSYPTTIMENNHGIAVIYESSMSIPTGDAELKRLQINLTVMEWGE